MNIKQEDNGTYTANFNLEEIGPMLEIIQKVETYKIENMRHQLEVAAEQHIGKIG